MPREWTADLANTVAEGEMTSYLESEDGKWDCWAAYVAWETCEHEADEVGTAWCTVVRVEDQFATEFRYPGRVRIDADADGRPLPSERDEEAFLDWCEERFEACMAEQGEAR